MVTASNTLYVHSHDTGRWVQPYGHQLPTPNIQHLADQGVLFRHSEIRLATELDLVPAVAG